MNNTDNVREIYKTITINYIQQQLNISVNDAKKIYGIINEYTDNHTKTNGIISQHELMHRKIKASISYTVDLSTFLGALDALLAKYLIYIP